ITLRTSAPASASPLRESRRAASAQGPRDAPDWRPSCRVAAIASTAGNPGLSSLISDPGIQRRTRQIDREADQDIRDARHDHHALNDWDIAVEDRFEDEPPH